MQALSYALFNLESLKHFRLIIRDQKFLLGYEAMLDFSISLGHLCHLKQLYLDFVDVCSINNKGLDFLAGGISGLSELEELTVYLKSKHTSIDDYGKMMFQRRIEPVVARLKKKKDILMRVDVPKHVPSSFAW